MAVFAVAAGIGGAFLAVGAFGYSVLRWGCPSDYELQHPIPRAEVEEAFADHGLDLQPAPFPVPLPPGARSYRHEADAASLYVVVCEQLCDSEDPQRVPDITQVDFPSSRGVTQRMRRGIILLNVHIYLADADRRSAQVLRERAEASADDLDPNPRPDDRCYVR
ncbi:MAG: hypothetical protein WD027_04790 [Gaiellales bacterium]